MKEPPPAIRRRALPFTTTLLWAAVVRNPAKVPVTASCAPADVFALKVVLAVSVTPMFNVVVALNSKVPPPIVSDAP